MSYIKQFNTVGVSRQHGEIKIRMANDIEWRKFMLTKEGHTDILLVDLGETMSKTEAVQKALTLPEFADHAEAQAVFTKYLTAQGVIEKVKKPRGRPAKAKAEDAEATTADAGEAQQEAAAEDVAAAEPTEALVDAVAETLAETAEADAEAVEV
jgi:hypothetical protein